MVGRDNLIIVYILNASNGVSLNNRSMVANAQNAVLPAETKNDNEESVVNDHASQ